MAPTFCAGIWFSLGLQRATPNLLEQFIVTIPDDRVLRLVSTPVLNQSQPESRAHLGKSYDWRELRHRRLGGLTSARVWVGWTGGCVGAAAMVAPGGCCSPPRPLDKFLEPAVWLSPWRKPGGLEPCWRPTALAAKPYPWPWENGPTWVEAPSVFIGARGGTIERPITVKEFCQLADLRADWGITLWDPMRRWNEGRTIPLRFLVEFAIATLPWISAELSETTSIKPGGGNQELGATLAVPDWGRARAPWLGLPLDPGHGASGAIEKKIAYFGWTWDDNDAGEVSLATKNNDAEVDLSMWAVGHDGPLLEPARQVIRNFLFAVWAKTICREARVWLRARLDDGTAVPADREAILDCVTRCANSTWWEWKDGSRLLFWQWPRAWWIEARDGAIGYHLAYPLPKLHYPLVPVKEE